MKVREFLCRCMDGITVELHDGNGDTLAIYNGKDVIPRWFNNANVEAISTNERGVLLFLENLPE